MSHLKKNHHELYIFARNSLVKIGIMINKNHRIDLKEIHVYFDKYANLMCNYAYNYLNDYSEAEDIVQDIFQRILEKKEIIFSNDISIKTYLLNSVRNSCINSLKKKNPVFYTFDIINFQIIDEEFASIDDNVIQRLQEEIFKLPPQTQKIIIGIFYQNQKYKEVADKLNISVNTVKSLLKSGIKNLRKTFGNNLEIILLLWYKKNLDFNHFKS